MTQLIRQIVKENLINKIAIVNSKDLGDNWSADFHVNRLQGKKPYLINNYMAVPGKTTGHHLRDAVYLTDEDAAKLNEVGSQIRELLSQFESLKGNFNDLKNELGSK